MNQSVVAGDRLCFFEPAEGYFVTLFVRDVRYEHDSLTVFARARNKDRVLTLHRESIRDVAPNIWLYLPDEHKPPSKVISDLADRMKQCEDDVREAERVRVKAHVANQLRRASQYDERHRLHNVLEFVA